MKLLKKYDVNSQKLHRVNRQQVEVKNLISVCILEDKGKKLLGYVKKGNGFNFLAIYEPLKKIPLAVKIIK